VLGLYGVGRAGRLTTWLGGPVMGYMGRTSYSLYLVHLPVLTVVLRAGYKLTGENRWAALLWLALAALCCFAAAHLLYVFVEAPSLKLVARFKPGRRVSVVPIERSSTGSVRMAA
jgi:peptidoglycan/LPS O-acetylase OafA/YrhL